MLLSIPPAAAETRVAFTVDDLLTHGPLPKGRTHAQVVRAMAGALKEGGIPGAVAFVTAFGAGTVKEQTALCRAWRKAGYGFGNHTSAHQDLRKLTAEEFRQAIDDTEPFLRKVAGEKRPRYFRYPWLQEGQTKEKRDAVRSHLRQKGYAVAPITVPLTERPWEKPYADCVSRRNKAGAAKLRKKFIERAVAGLKLAEEAAKAVHEKPVPQVFMLHAGAIQADTLPELLRAFRAEGVRFISLDEAMADPALTADTEHVSEHSRFYYDQLAQKAGKPAARAIPPAQAEIERFCD